MRIIIATLVVITVALGLVDTAGAFDPNTFCPLGSMELAPVLQRPGP
jgi:hypothetical protein